VYLNLIKPVADFFVALFAMLLLSPLIFFATLALAIANKGSVFFLQNRPKKNERIFNIIKFKTMTDERDDQGNLLPDEKRLTAVGALVRKTSIDELPQLINVLKGDMSLIGPRPLLPEYLLLYSDRQKKRHDVKPGITGWAQVNGRNTISWDKKFEYDVWYTENVSITLDVKILYLTVLKVLKSEDIAADNHISMPKFSDEFKNQN
jgi:lipopolysaccharide/colanic/teichoic acid biosynthesis glycosyltransferase